MGQEGGATAEERRSSTGSRGRGARRRDGSSRACRRRVMGDRMGVGTVGTAGERTVEEGVGGEGRVAGGTEGVRGGVL